MSEELINKATEYLANGGLFNPESMDHERVRDLIYQMRGAMRAQDEREREAGARCGVGAELHGCDWPDAVADQVLMLKANNELLEKRNDYCTKIESEVAILRKENEAMKKRERDRWSSAASAFGDLDYEGTLRPGDF